jgi:hypothetical protein
MFQNLPANEFLICVQDLTVVPPLGGAFEMTGDVRRLRLTGGIPVTGEKERRMSRRTHFIVSMIVTLFITPLFTAPLWAVSLTPGDFVNLSGTTLAARPELAGTVLVDTIRPFSVDLGGGNFTTGTIQDSVRREDGTGTLDFSYRIINDVSSSGSIDFVTRTAYTGFSTDVDWRSDGLGTIAPDQASRNAAGDQVLFDFFADNLLFPGAESRFFFIKTDAIDFNEGGTGELAVTGNVGGNTFTFNTYQPAVVVPGDYNNNGIVDAADYTVWRDHLGQSFALPNRSAANTGPIAAADFNFWKTQFGQHAGSGSGALTAVPEPATLWMLLVAAAGVSTRRRWCA